MSLTHTGKGQATMPGVVEYTVVVMITAGIVLLPLLKPYANQFIDAVTKALKYKPTETSQPNKIRPPPCFEYDSFSAHHISDATEAITAAMSCLESCYYTNERDPGFQKCRTRLFCEAWLYGELIHKRTLDLVTYLIHITDTYTHLHDLAIAKDDYYMLEQEWIPLRSASLELNKSYSKVRERLELVDDRKNDEEVGAENIGRLSPCVEMFRDALM